MVEHTTCNEKKNNKMKGKNIDFKETNTKNTLNLRVEKETKKNLIHTCTKKIGGKYQSKKDKRTPRTHNKEALKNNKNAQQGGDKDVIEIFGLEHVVRKC